jgi:hypothetical protein
MAPKDPPVLLNADELAFLSELLSCDHDELIDSNKLVYNITGSAVGESVLTQMSCVGGLQLVANDGNHQLVFPVQIEPDDFKHLKMVLKPPEIFEIGIHPRAWRFLVNNKNIYLAHINEAGNESYFQIEDLSASGVSFLIEEHTDAEFPTVFNDVFLQLPNHQKLAVSGLQICRIDKKTVAYTFPKTANEATLNSLYEYLFECHVKQYPEAHKDQSK